MMCVLAGALAALGACKNDGNATQSASASPASAVPAGARVVAITATDQGFTPASVPVKKGETVVLRFTRTTQSECLKQVVLPDLNVKKDLPVNTPVDVTIKADKEGKIAFQCWMGMFKGSVDVTS